ncbi:MAG: hypothetical protein HY235_01105 [Acidobacteria bacterium]|nr:hypothetical protein [Acidobacteriota bacterium]
MEIAAVEGEQPARRAVRRWADDELRSLNGQIEYILRGALNKRGRLRSSPAQVDEAQNKERGQNVE